MLGLEGEKKTKVCARLQICIVKACGSFTAAPKYGLQRESDYWGEPSSVQVPGDVCPLGTFSTRLASLQVPFTLYANMHTYKQLDFLVKQWPLCLQLLKNRCRSKGLGLFLGGADEQKESNTRNQETVARGEAARSCAEPMKPVREGHC